MASDFYNNSIFWIEVNRIQPNPFQPRKVFNEDSLRSLSDSIRQYGVLQPLVVTRKEIEMGNGGISVEYEIVAGERRLRASKLAGLTQVPVLIRSTEDTDKMKLEIAIIENLQREDLNPVDRALAFKQLADEFKLKHVEIANKVGKSRVYVSNSLRILALPEDMLGAVINGEITEGHTRPLLMLCDHIEQRKALFEEILDRHITVREAEKIARDIAVEKARKPLLTPDMETLEKTLSEKLGTRVTIETRKRGGRMHIDFFSEKDIHFLLSKLSKDVSTHSSSDKNIAKKSKEKTKLWVKSPLALFVESGDNMQESLDNNLEKQISPSFLEDINFVKEIETSVETPNKEDTEKEDEDLYSLSNFAI